ncbi:MAG: hypothetical protein AB1630_01385 [bacterium]
MSNTDTSMALINESLRKIGYSFEGNVAILYYNQKIINSIPINSLRYNRNEKPELPEKIQLKIGTRLESSKILFEMFLLGALAKFQYIRFLQEQEIAGRIKLTKKDFLEILRVGLKSKPCESITGDILGNEVTYKNSIDETKSLFTIHFSEFGSITSKEYFYEFRDNSFIPEEDQRRFLAKLFGDEETSSDNACLFGLIFNEINHDEYIGYRKTRQQKSERLKRMDRNKIEDFPIIIETHSVNELECKVFNKEAMIKIEKADRKFTETAGYSVKLTSNKKKINLVIFDLVKVKIKNEINFAEVKWVDNSKKEFGLYCAPYIRQRMGGLANLALS